MKNVLILLSVLLLSASLRAQTPPPDTQQQPPAAPQGPALQEATNKTLQEVASLIQTGKADAAAEKLKALENSPDATPPVRSLIGALYLQINRPQEAMALLQPLADAEDAQPAVLYNAGRAALLLGNVDAGRLYLTRSVLLEPASPAARDLGFLTAREGRVVEAYSMLRPWALHNPEDTDARLMAASLALQLERPDAAAELLNGLPENDPALKLLRGKILVQKKDGRGAVALLTPLLANHPQGMETEVRRTLAEAQLLAGNAAEAVKLLDGHTAGYPSLDLLLARAQRKAGNAAAATATLKPLADKLPEDLNTLGDPRPAAGIALEYGTLLMDAGKAQEAVPLLEKSTRYYPRNPDAWKSLARALEATGRKEDAQKALAQAVEAAKPPVKPAAAPPAASTAAAAPPAAPAQEPPLSEGLQSALRLMNQNQIEGALAAVRQEIGISKDSDPRARMLEIRLLLQLKRPEEALKIAEQILQKDPNNPGFLYMRGVTQMSLQRWASAEQDLRKTLQLAPRHTGAMNDLAVLLMNLNKKDEARKLLQQVLQLNPQDRMAASNLQKLDQEP
ncbi:MAG TPA: tetratricopeptide repeat protein [Thermoanaerobaculia bacterium]|jgi:Flp pilus assembly protein TadD|nr:tetratricopeptide repeat protein [Thermoanaerobaculia bacterium]